MPRYTYTISPDLTRVVEFSGVTELLGPVITVNATTAKYMTPTKQNELGKKLCDYFKMLTKLEHRVTQILVRKTKLNNEDIIKTRQIQRSVDNATDA